MGWWKTTPDLISQINWVWNPYFRQSSNLSFLPLAITQSLKCTFRSETICEATPQPGFVSTYILSGKLVLGSPSHFRQAVLLNHFKYWLWQVWNELCEGIPKKSYHIFLLARVSIFLIASILLRADFKPSGQGILSPRGLFSISLDLLWISSI